MKEIPPHIAKKVDKMIGNMKEVYDLAMESWEGCDGCDENDKHFFMKGFQAGYNRTKPDVISDEEALRLAKEMNKQPLTSVPSEISDKEIEKEAFDYVENSEEDKWTATLTFMAGVEWYREQLKRNI
jgi:hypothetical protein